MLVKLLLNFKQSVRILQNNKSETKREIITYKNKNLESNWKHSYDNTILSGISYPKIPLKSHEEVWSCLDIVCRGRLYHVVAIHNLTMLINNPTISV